jgi:putative ABC transport system permease protein
MLITGTINNKSGMIHISEIRQIFRSLYRSKLLTSINILGLGIGLGSVILLTTFLIHEFSFDRYNSKSDRIYRVVDDKSCATYYAMGEAFKQDIPEIEKVCRITNLSDVYTVILSKDNESYPLNSFIATDPVLFDILDIDFVEKPGGFEHFKNGEVLISDRMARKYFEKSEPVGQLMQFYIANKKQTLQVSGVFKHLPTYSSLQADFICDISLAMDQFTDLEYSLGLRDKKSTFDFYNDWTNNNSFTTIILLNNNADLASIENKCTNTCLKHRSENTGKQIHLQPYSEIYLQSQGLENANLLKASRFDSLRIFLTIGILILLVACLNYILISSSEQEQAYTSIACRKVNGASGQKIVLLIMLKTFIVSFCSLVPAFIFAKLALPLFNNYFETQLNFLLFLKWQYLVAMLLITIITAVSAGSYLSFLATKTNPAGLLQKNLRKTKRTWYFNQGLVVFQFFVFILLLSCVFIMRRQMNFSVTTDMGFETKNLMVVDLGTENVKNQSTAIINQVKQIPHVLACQPTTFFLPPNDNILFASFKDQETGESREQEAIFIAAGNVELLNIPLVDGTSFSETDTKNPNNILLNETAAKKFEVKAGMKLFHFNVKGILKDFHNKSIHEAIRPLMIIQQTSGFTNLLIKTDGANAEVASQVKNIILGIEPGYYFESELLTDRVNSFYATDRQHTKIISFFSIVALVLSFMGLFGFVSLALSKRIKEIGIRKINGARISEILLLLNREFIIWVLAAFIIATPIAWYAMHRWLESFAYKAEMSWWIFAFAGLLALGIALLTVSWQSFRAANRNPVEALRYQ